jgi:hypothetical protein
MVKADVPQSVKVGLQTVKSVLRSRGRPKQQVAAAVRDAETR